MLNPLSHTRPTFSLLIFFLSYILTNSKGLHMYTDILEKLYKT